MIKLKKYTSYVIMFLFAIALLAFSSSDSLLERIIIQLNNYRVVNPVDKVYLHIDSPHYFTNEYIYFKPYLVNGHSLLPESEASLYIELVNNQNEAIIQTKFKYNRNNLRGGSIHIPDTLLSGQYRIVAYTNWMKNYSSSFFYDQSIQIYNINEVGETTENESQNLSVTFFPEGGNLVNGLTSKVGFNAIDQDGKGVTISGKIIDSNANEVAMFNTVHAGIGSFIFQPRAEQNYKAIITFNKDTLTYDLPKILREGAVIQVNNFGRESIKVSVQSKNEDYSGSYLLVAQANNKIFYSAESNNENKGFVAAIPKANLPEGITQITLFDEMGVPLCERLVFINNEAISSTVIRSDKISVSSRDIVNVIVEAPINSNLSASVSTRIREKYTDNIYNNLLLSSDLKGEIELPGFYFDHNNPYATIALDNLLLTQGWRRFTWKEVLDYHPVKARYNFERDLMIKGIVYDNSMNPMTDHKLSISIPQELSSYEATTDSLGRVEAFVFNYYGKKQIVIQPLEENKQTIFAPNEGFTYRKIDLPSAPRTYTSNDAVIQQQRENMEISNSFNMNYHRAVDLSNSAILELTNDNYSKLYDKETRLSEFISFPTMRDVFREIVPGVSVQFTSNRVKMFSKDNQVNFKGPPLYMVDGIPTYNSEYILGLNPAEIESIGLISSNDNLNKFGYLGKNGIIAINSKSGKTISKIPEDKTFVSYQGFTMVTEYYTPTYQSVKSKNSRTPDLRSLMYWNPNIRTNLDGSTEIEFYTSDQKGTYEVVIEGITDAGIPVSTSTTFEVY